MQIQIIATSVETKVGPSGKPYQLLEVTFKNLTYGKTESKKLMPFGANAEAFKALSIAQAGSTWEVSVTKNTQGYNDWTSVKSSAGGPEPAAPVKAAGNASPAARSSYETPEERAQRQVLIVRQSSLSAAVATLAVGSKGLKPADVIAVAKEYENYVFDIKDPGPSGFEDLPNFDVPEVS